MNIHITLTKQAQKGFAKAPQQVQNKLLKWMQDVEAKGLTVVSVQPAYHDEPLTGQRQGQ
jgi:proteic killer suppression protein